MIIAQKHCQSRPRSRFQAPARNSLKMALPLSRSLPALLKQYWYTKRGERVRVRGHAPFYATLGLNNTSSIETRGVLLRTAALLSRNDAVAKGKLLDSESGSGRQA